MSIRTRSKVAREVPTAIQKKSGIMIAWGDPKKPALEDRGVDQG